MSPGHLVTPSPIRALLGADRVWAVFALADLHPRFAHVCKWTVTDSAVVLLYAGITPPILLTCGPAADVAAALAQTDLPERVYLSVRQEHLPAVQRWYDTSRDYRPMWRMVWRGGADAGGGEMTPGLVRLGVEDGGRLARLYAQGGEFAPDAFDPSQLADGTFWGVEKAGELIAAGGTHVTDATESVAVIGNIYTRLDRRGRGYGKTIIRAITAHLQQRGIDLIALNVDQSNHAAVSLYEQLGFVKHCPFVEGKAMSKE